MTQTRNLPIPRSTPAAPENDGVEMPDPPEMGGKALATIFAVAVVALGILAGTVLLGWLMLRAADVLGLLSS